MQHASREAAQWLAEGGAARGPAQAPEASAGAPAAGFGAGTDWATVDLPDAWPDQLDLARPGAALGLIARALSGRRGRVELPAGLPGAAGIPKYVLQEFHNLPNGNYSKRLTRGYAIWFDRAMLGTLREGRRRLVQALHGATSVLDIGCGAGHTAGALRDAGVPRVTGLDPSPYLLQQAAKAYPGVHWLHGVGECIALPDASQDAVSCCFVLHEVPPRYLRGVLREVARVLKPGGRFVVCEPSVVQWRDGWWALARRWGWRGVYFKLLAMRIFEPFADAWHRQDFGALLAEHGFAVETDEAGCPLRFVLARRLDN